MTIDLDALEKRLVAGSKQTITRYFGDLSGAIVDHDLLREAASAVAELREARGLLGDLVREVFDAITSDGEAQDCKAAELADLVDMARHAHRAFLARNGKGEG